MIDRATFVIPLFTMVCVGSLLESSFHFLFKLALISLVLFCVKFVSSTYLTSNSSEILPFATYLAQKVLMYFTWFHYFWNEVSGFTNSMLLLNSIFLWNNFLKTVFSDPGFLKKSMESKKQVSPPCYAFTERGGVMF